MNYHLLKGTSGKTDEICLLFSGWGTDARLFQAYTPQTDLLILYDYRSLEDFPLQLLLPYKQVRVVAWSLGIWAAARTLSALQLPIVNAIAINGTLHPIDESRGIPPAIYQGTWAALTDRTLDKFRRRMCGMQYSHFMENAPQRSVEELREELLAIREAYQQAPATTLKWNQAIISLNDKIFTPQNQRQAWTEAGVTTTEIETPHYLTNLLEWV